MAAPEARAMWQRVVNRAFVGEDAKRAPKLATCQSLSPLSSKLLEGATPGNFDGIPYLLPPGFLPLIRNPSYCNMPTDVTWWLQLHGYPSGLAYEHFTRLFPGIENAKAFPIHFPSKPGQVSVPEEIKCSPNCSDSVVCRHSKLDFHGCMDELVGFCTPKTTDLIENCDLPPPQKIHRGCEPTCAHLLDHDAAKNSSQEPKVWVDSIPGATVGPKRHTTFESMQMKETYWSEERTYDSKLSTAPSKMDDKHGLHCHESDPSNSKLLEALCHSQTRAREAEKMARQVSNEKEDLINLFLQQASQLFTYKQWLKLMQLEVFYSTGNRHPPMTARFPWTTKRVHHRKHKTSRRYHVKLQYTRHGPSRPTTINGYTVVFVLGISLVGSGLLLGWTVGWWLCL